MDSACPVKIETIRDDENEMKKTYCDITINNKIYTLEFGKSEDRKNLFFKISNNDNKNYLKTLNLEEFYKLNSIFKLYQSIDQIYNILSNVINNKKYSSELKDKYILLKIQLFTPDGETIFFDLDLMENNKTNNNNTNENLNTTINNLILENNLIKKELENKNEEILLLKNQYIILENKIKNIEEFLKKSEEKKDEKYFDLNNSKIAINTSEKDNLINWISTKGKIKKINLLYFSEKDGDSATAFFEKCKNKGPTMSIIYTKKGRKFGGFSKAEWTDKNGNIRIKDNDAFIFSLNNNKKYNILKPEHAIACYPYYDLMVYGNNEDGNGFYIVDGFLKQESYENHSTKVYDVPSDYCLSESRTFYAEVIEVYQIIFE